MHWLDYVVLVGYFVMMAGIGYICMRLVKAQEDYFMGGRGFGKLLQTFAAFGAGTGSSDPVATGRTTFTSGLSGMWSVMSWLFVTPFYWITGVWYRRMRHLTLGDWFVERYESKAMGAAYCLFGLTFFMVYGSMMFSAIGKVAAPLVGFESFQLGGHVYGIEYLLVPVIGVVVVVYGILGGLHAAYWSDLIQGICIILLSILLIPFGLNALVEKFGDPSTDGLMAGFRILHEQLPEGHFTIVGSTSTSDFPIHRIIAVVIISLVGIVVQPHFIATGGGSAKTETNARVGLVFGNFLKRFCTIGWVLTALIALALYANSPVLDEDPDKTWGIASRELLPAGLTGLMLACLLAALMSSVDAYMIVGSALMVRNLYAPYINANASEKQYVFLGRLTGIIVVAGAVLVSLYMMNVFEQLQLTWVFPVLFAAPFWIGMYWRRATTAAAWSTVLYCLTVFFLVPNLAPVVVPALRTNSHYHVANDLVQTTTTRAAAPSDVARRNARIENWERRHGEIEKMDDSQLRTSRLDRLGPRPEKLVVGESFTVANTTGGTSVFWSAGVKPVDEQGNVLEDVIQQPVGEPRNIDDETVEQILRYGEDVRLVGRGNFRPDFLLYQWLGMNLTATTDATLATLELPPKIIAPFLVMILLSFVTPRNSKQALDRYYVKMKTPVLPDREEDRLELERSYAEPDRFDHKKLFAGSSLEFSKPTTTDVVGFIVSVAVCFGIIGLAMLVGSIGS